MAQNSTATKDQDDVLEKQKRDFKSLFLLYSLFT